MRGTFIETLFFVIVIVIVIVFLCFVTFKPPLLFPLFKVVATVKSIEAYSCSLEFQSVL